MTEYLSIPIGAATSSLGGLFCGGAIFFGMCLVTHRYRKKILADCAALQQRQSAAVEKEMRRAHAHLTAELQQRRHEATEAIKKDRQDVERLIQRAELRQETVVRKEAQLDEAHKTLARKLEQLDAEQQRIVAQLAQLASTEQSLNERLEQIAGLSQEEARAILMKNIESEARAASERLIAKIEEDTRQIAKERAATIVVGAMQRHAAEHVNQHAVGVVHLPNEEMKGRIIGKDGRNIKALEMATGMEFVVGEAPEIITVSGFNPVRREVARRSLERLILDGRINPTRIEETVEDVEREVEEIIEEYGRETIMRFRMHSMKHEMVSTLGKLHFRTSFSQNVLQHSIEVGVFARIIAEELGLPKPDIALRGGLLHDIGKALSAEQEGPHALIGADLARRCGEDPLVVNAIAAHHEEVPFQSIYGPIVMIADTISACRPGARRETLTTYIKRLEQLEEIAYDFTGVKRAYAVQAGREIRVIVEEEKLNDEGALHLARDLARRIEEDMAFPGQIKVNVIREKRAIEYAR